MPLLARMLPAPLSIEVRRGAVAHLGELLADRRIANEGRVAIAVGPGQGDQIADDVRPGLTDCDVFRIDAGTADSAVELGAKLRKGWYEAVVGIGGGRTIDSTKYAATLAGIPMVSVATNLSHDGICSPTASLEHDEGKSSFGVTMPLAVIVDLDYVHAAPDQLVRAGIGDVVSNFSAVDDWLLAARETGEPVDRLALTLARTAAEALLYQPDSIESDRFLTVLAEGLVLSGMAMSFAGRRGRPAAATTRSCTRSTRCTPAPPTTGSWPGSARRSATTCAPASSARATGATRPRTGSRTSSAAWTGTGCPTCRPTWG
jgi:glycerol-1-phosphate dehydrogenase [NAD(P)+]